MDKVAFLNLEYGIPFAHPTLAKAGMACTLRALTEDEMDGVQQMLKDAQSKEEKVTDADKRLLIAKCVALLLGDENAHRIFEESEAAQIGKKVPLRIQNEIIKKGLQYQTIKDLDEEKKS